MNGNNNTSALMSHEATAETTSAKLNAYQIEHCLEWLAENGYADVAEAPLPGDFELGSLNFEFQPLDFNRLRAGIAAYLQARNAILTPTYVNAAAS